MVELVITHSREITALQESTKSAHHRITEINNVADGIHNLARSIAEMAVEIKHLATRIDTSIERMEGGQKAQGERIGNIEKALVIMEQHGKIIEEQGRQLAAMEKVAGKKWDKFTWLIISGIAAAVVAFAMSRILPVG